MLTLVSKDFRLLYGSFFGSKKKIASLAFSLLALAFFVVVETFFYLAILNRIKNYKDAPVSFTVLYLFLLSLIMILSDLVRARKLFFDKKDSFLLSSYPLKSDTIILSKVLLLLLTQTLTSLLFTYPIFVSYGIVFSRTALYYFLALFYPIMMFFFEAGIAFLLVYPYSLLHDFLEWHKGIQFLIYLLFMAGFSLLYGRVLNLFVALVAQGELGSLFTKASLDSLSHVRRYFFVCNNVADFLFFYRFLSLLPYFLLSLLAFFGGLAVVIPCYQKERLRQQKKQEEKRGKPHLFRVLTPTKALFEKEFIFLFRNQDNFLSFTGLLLVQPYLAFVVISGMNTIFTHGILGYYLLVIPDLVSAIDLLFLLFFALMIASGGNDFLSREKNSLKIMKTIPISASKQLWIKLSIPYLVSCLSSLITVMVLAITKTMSWPLALAGLMLSFLATLSFDLLSMIEELKKKARFGTRNLVSNLYGYLFPIVTAGLLILGSSLRWNQIGTIFLWLTLALFFTLALLFYFRKNQRILFTEMEVTSE
ncbi:MAG: hypothetical protein PUC66_02400 [Erysipelotrichaceae bacterium]|nr:hypothetical protein [Erysipelotrichaceae bacterium]